MIPISQASARSLHYVTQFQGLEAGASQSLYQIGLSRRVLAISLGLAFAFSSYWVGMVIGDCLSGYDVIKFCQPIVRLENHILNGYSSENATILKLHLLDNFHKVNCSSAVQGDFMPQGNTADDVKLLLPL